MADDRATPLAAAEATLTKVLSLAPNHPMAHYLTGLVEIFSNRAAQGIAECERRMAAAFAVRTASLRAVRQHRPQRWLAYISKCCRDTFTR